MSISDHIPRDYARIEVVESLSVLFDSKAQPHVNARVFQRPIEGDFDGLARRLYDVFGATHSRLHQDGLEKFSSKEPAFQNELATIIEDMKTCTHLPEHYPGLRIIEPFNYIYQKDGSHQFHGDGTEWRVIICYNRPTTAWIRNEDALIYGTKYDEYTLRPGGQEYEFVPGDIWRQRGKDGYRRTFIHRAQEMDADNAPRLLLVG